VKGHNVSHSNKKTPREFGVNLKVKKIFVPELNKWVTLKLSTTAIKTINKKRGLCHHQRSSRKRFFR